MTEEPIVLEIKLADNTDTATLIQLIKEAEYNNEFGSPVACRIVDCPDPPLAD